MGSNDVLFSQNKQNEPGLAVNPVNPTSWPPARTTTSTWRRATPATTARARSPQASGCRASSSPPTRGVRGCSRRTPASPPAPHRAASGQPDVAPGQPPAGDTGCVPDPNGPIGTLPHYFASGMVSNGDPEVVFGPVPDDDGDFSWANGQRLYYANIATPFPGEPRVCRCGRDRGLADRRHRGRDRRRQRRLDAPGRGDQAELRAVQRQGAALGRQRRVEPALRQRIRVQRRRSAARPDPSRCCSPAPPTAATPGLPGS